MQNIIKISMIRGAGLSFPIACVLFLFLGQPFAFALVPAGALVGLGVGAYLARNPTIEHKLQAAMHTDRTKTARPNWFTKYLFHANLVIRLISLEIFGAGLLFVI